MNGAGGGGGVATEAAQQAQAHQHNPLIARTQAQEEQEKTFRSMPAPGGESSELDEDAAQLRLGPDLQNCACLFSSEIVQVLEANKNVMTSSE